MVRFRPHRAKADGLNKLEQAFSLELGIRKRAGELVWAEHEPFKLRLAKNTFYTPDFASLSTGGEMCIYEVKGFWEDDARVKIKVAAKAFPFFRFIGVEKKKGSWVWEDFS